MNEGTKAPVQAAESATAGSLIFRWRSYLPVVVVAMLMLGLYAFGPTPAAWVRHCVGIGSVVAALGLLLRFYAVGHAPAGTSGRHRRQFASRLNTFGVYSVMRHPLYVGNVLVWLGVSLTSGWLPGAAISCVAGLLMFGVIVRAEDAFLLRRFGSDFAEWAAVTPAFIPRMRLWRPTRQSFQWAKAVASEYSTLHSIGLLVLLFAALRGWRSQASWTPSAWWWALLAANSGLYLGVRAWRSRRGSARQAPLGSSAGDA